MRFISLTEGYTPVTIYIAFLAFVVTCFLGLFYEMTTL